MKNNNKDEDLVKIIQKQYNDFRIGGFWVCSCTNIIPYSDRYVELGDIDLRVRCKKCNEYVEHFETRNKDISFQSKEFDELFKRYYQQILNCCQKFAYIEDSGNVMGDMSYRFLISVMKYNGKSKFKTYMWTNIKRRFEDFERRNSRVSKNNAVQCQLCGRHVGVITRIHLMNNKVKSLDGYPGHTILHKKIIKEDIGEERFKLMSDLDDTLSLKKLKWEGNKYSSKQNKEIRSLITNAYRRMFPNHPLSISNISISDIDPKTKIEYINMIQDTTTRNVPVKGYFVTANIKASSKRKKINDQIFIPEEISVKDIDICKDFASKVTPILHRKYSCNKIRKNFKNTKDEIGLKHFLENVLPYILKGYNIREIKSLKGLDRGELSFWLNKIKKTKEIVSKNKVQIAM